MQVEEIEYFRQDSMLVTSTRIELGGQTFSVRNVGSVKVTQPRRPYIALFMAILGLVSLINPESRQVGAFIFAVAAWVIYKKLRTRRLVLVSGGGETTALTTTNQELVEQLRSAIAKAISTR